MAMKLRKLVFVCLSVGLLQGADIKLNDAPANSFQDAFERGLIYGHAGLLFQQSIDKAPTYGDINLSLGYESRRFMGYKFGAELWLIPKLYEGSPNDFRKSQTYFEMSQIYADYYNQYERFGGTIGRFRANEEWITHFNEGLALSYDQIPNLSLAFMWSLRNAYITPHFSQNYKVFGEYQSGKVGKWTGGAFYLRATLSIPQAPIKLTPYIYLVPDFFVAPGLKGELDLPITQKVLFKGMVHLTSYVELNDQRKVLNSGGGGIIWAEGGVDMSWIRIGAGIINTPKGGAIYIDGFGQNTPFERADGIFYYNATTPYVFVSSDLWKYVSVYGAFRTSIINAQSALNWEARMDITPIQNVRMGISALGVSNPTQAPSKFGQNLGSYMIFRGYVEYHF